jgi:predicted DsbA family dithiol-disulfide isomerase
MAQAAPVHIDFVGDVVCPWCLLGWTRLNAALARRPDLEPQIVWRPYQLQFDIPEAGLPYAAFMAGLFPDADRRREMDDRLTEMGAAEGVDFRLDLIPMRPNTNAAHRLIRWATQLGLGGPAVEAVMSAHFSHGRDIGDPATLAAIAGEIGMDAASVAARLASGEDRAVVDEECRMASRAGITGVPFTILADRIAVSGAETPERLLQALDKALEAGG